MEVEDWTKEEQLNWISVKIGKLSIEMSQVQAGILIPRAANSARNRSAGRFQPKSLRG